MFKFLRKIFNPEPLVDLEQCFAVYEKIQKQRQREERREYQKAYHDLKAALKETIVEYEGEERRKNPLTNVDRRRTIGVHGHHE